ncbi:MAG TPA: N-glycosylase/DNA lyase [Candidatus Kapabacteria bacterium]|nr:N-glycosylase/DNA lyase [Candidatus Kapabacteria bacterium]
MQPALPEPIRARYEELQHAIRARLAEFAAVSAGEYFYELCYCLLTPQSSARNVEKTIALLKEKDFFNTPFDAAPILRRKEHYVRFHLTKAKRLLKAREQFSKIEEELRFDTTPEKKREWLVANVDGMSLKEASHFLRNIGCRELAILDRHIITHLVHCGILRKRPKTLTPKRYVRIEKKFRQFSVKIGIPMDELDLLFWSNETGIILK